MKPKVLSFGCSIALVLLTAMPIFADIIGAAPPEVAVPEALLTELDEEIAQQLKPLMPLFVSNDFAGYKEQYLKIAATTETLPAAEVFWAKLLITSNRFADATRVLEEYVRDHQEDPEVYVTLGILAARSGRFTDGWLHLLYAQRLIDRDGLKKDRKKLVMPNFLEARCVVAENRRQWAEAEQMFQKLQSLKPDDHSIKWRAGRCQVLAGKLEAGHQMMSEANQANSKLPKATLAVAQILSDSTDWAKNAERAGEVEAWFTRAVEESPEESTVHIAYLKWLLLDNRPELVRDKFDALPEDLKSVREIILLRCLAARYLDDFALAETLLTPLHQQNQDDLEVADQLALVLVESSDEAKRGRALQLSERNFRAASDIETIAATARRLTADTKNVTGDAESEAAALVLSSRVTPIARLGSMTACTMIATVNSGQAAREKKNIQRPTRETTGRPTARASSASTIARTAPAIGNPICREVSIGT